MTTRWGLVALLALGSIGCPSPPPKPPPPDLPPEPPPTVEKPPPALPPDAVKSVATFVEHHCLLRVGGTIACWGKNTSGQLGNGSRDHSAEPVEVAGISDATAVAVGRDFSCALRGGGKVSCWGNNEDGQLGDGKGMAPAAISLTPVEPTGLSGVVQLALGEYHACVRERGGRVACWGNGADGQLGRSVKRAFGTPVEVETLGPVKQIAIGASHGCALQEGGTVRCWGRNTEGQLGNGVSGSRSNHVAVSGLDGVKQIASGHLHTCAMKDDGGVWCWGDNKSLQAGPGASDTKAKTPVLVSGLDDVAQIAGGGRHTCARLRSKKVVCWGADDKGQLGAGGGGAARAEAKEAAAGKGALDLVLGDAQTCAVLPAGKATCWGAVQKELGPSAPP